ncbi:hypothetical protein V8G54_015869 [Vigna mungo]|uniref:Isopropylmalate dehydrogenase-like domain-containing protein n=1 Tax=Vigna mungo TaxID=3915 RepID=A0AAQ3NJ87_VIGMU
MNVTAFAGNVGADHAVFEQGASAGNVGNEKVVEQQKANPVALLLSSAMMLRHLQFPAFADRLETAVKKVILEGKYRTKDLGGKSTTQEVVDAQYELQIIIVIIINVIIKIKMSGGSLVFVLLNYASLEKQAMKGEKGFHFWL